MTRLVIVTIVALAMCGTCASSLRAASETCFLKGQRVDGMNRICYYDCVSGDAAITVKSVQLCPISIRR